MAPDRLFRALLVEMAAGDFMQGERFLSHRRIMRQWRVAADTATRALELLQAAHVVQVRDRSGHYLPEGFRENALLALHQAEGHTINITPLQQHKLGMKILLQERAGHALSRVAVVLILQGDRQVRRDDCDLMFGSNAAASLTARGIFLEAEEHRLPVDFFLCNGSRDSISHTLARVLHVRPDGVMIINRVDLFQTKSLGESLLQRGLPVVVLYEEGKGSDMVSVNFNNVGMGSTAADMLISKGHRRLGILLRQNANGNVEDRLRGVRLRTGKEKKAALFECRYQEDCASIAAELRRNRITALFSTGEELLAGLLPELEKLAIRIPADLSVLMCSSTPSVRNYAKPVDTLILDFTLLGRMAFRAMEGYCCGQVTQKAYLLDPVVETHGTITGFPRAGGKP